MTAINAAYSSHLSRHCRWWQAGLAPIGILFIVSILLLSWQQSASLTLSGAAPDDLSADEWESIQSQIAAAEYHFTSIGDRWAAPNRAQGWQTTFGPEGIQVSPADGHWSWGLALTGYGYGQDHQVFEGIADLTVDKAAITYRWDDNLSEWWINSPAGLEQGFTLQERPGPTQSQSLQIEMAVSGTLTPLMDGGDILFQNDSGETILRYDQLHVVDADGQSIPARLALPHSQFGTRNSSFTIRILVEDRNAAYPLTIDPWLRQAKLTADDGVAGDIFGGSVSISGDTVVIGAERNDGPGNRSGAAYVFVRSGASWSQQAKLMAGDAVAGADFGWSVAIDGDTIVIGAPHNGGAGLYSGSAYVFVRSGANWNQQAKLAAGDAAAGDQFGVSVSVSGNTAVVGAYRDAVGSIDAGSAYVFVRNGTSWNQQAKLTAADAASDDFFGWSVAVDGDTVVIGAFRDSDSGDISGSAYVFTRNGANWSQQTKLIAADAAATDIFGWSVAIDEDTIVIGAEGDDDGGDYSGSAYVFVRSGASWSQQAKLTAADAASGDSFSSSVAVDEDTIVIGAEGDDDGGNNSGSAYVFVRNGASWSQQAKLTAADAAAGDYFGISIAVDGDTAVIGASGDDDSGNNSGSAYIFASCIGSIRDGNWGATTTWEGSITPTIEDGACIQNGHNVSLNAAAAVDWLWIYSGGLLDLSTYDFTVENGVWNYGAVQQTQTIGASGAFNFLQIQPNGGGPDQYRGVDIDTTSSGDELGTTIVRVLGNTAVCNNNDGGSYRDRCFMINPANAGSAILTLHTTPGEDDISDDAFFQYASGTTWTEGDACSDGVGVGGSCTGTALFASPAWFLVGSSSHDPTAVSLQSLSAHTSTNTVMLPIMAALVFPTFLVSVIAFSLTTVPKHFSLLLELKKQGHKRWRLTQWHPVFIRRSFHLLLPTESERQRYPWLMPLPLAALIFTVVGFIVFIVSIGSFLVR